MESATGRSTTEREQLALCTLAGISGLQLLHASYRTRSFPRHSHEGYGFGVIEQGALGFYYRGENIVAPAGWINTVNPDEVHTGQAADAQGWTYRMFYCTTACMRQISEDVHGRPVPLPHFRAGVIRDPELAGMLRLVHQRLCDHQSIRLEKDTIALTVLSRLLARHTQLSPAREGLGSERAAIRRVIDYLDAHCSEDLSVDALARIACLSRFHFIRVFARHTGLTPHAWLMQHRARKAQQLLGQGQDIAEVAAQTGFADQSHLHKIFKRLFGYTPGQLRNSVQDA